jgi:hypothetical protein
MIFFLASFTLPSIYTNEDLVVGIFQAFTCFAWQGGTISLHQNCRNRNTTQFRCSMANKPTDPTNNLFAKLEYFVKYAVNKLPLHLSRIPDLEYIQGP